ncbi:MAG: YigZ family protein [Caldisericaceae bacterium]
MRYKTIETDLSIRVNIQRSIFISHVKRIFTKEDAEEFIKNIKDEYKDATHNPFAYRLLNGTFQYSDDGEPSKSASIPIFNAIRSNGVYNVAVVVTRYFGGVKLGIPGLIEAYYSTADFAIKSAKVVEVSTKKRFKISLPYQSLNYLYYVLSKVESKVLEKNFGEFSIFEIEINEDDEEKFLGLLSKEKSIQYL